MPACFRNSLSLTSADDQPLRGVVPQVDEAIVGSIIKLRCAPLLCDILVRYSTADILDLLKLNAVSTS